MPKKSEDYRGEDRTLEMIRARVPTMPENYNQAWNETCEKIADEMKAEGLNTTAEFVLSYMINH